jgi:hypothetical protein
MEEVRANSMSNVNNALIGIQGAFAAPSRQSTESAKQAKPPTQAEIRAQQEQQQRTQQTLQRANMATGGILDDNILSMAQQKLDGGPSAIQLSRQTGTSLRDLGDQIPAAIQGEQMKFQIQSNQLMQQQQQLSMESQQLESQIQQAEAAGLPVDPTLLERREQIKQQGQQLDQAGLRLREDSAASTTALLLKQQQIEEARKAIAKQTMAQLKEAGNKGKAEDKPVKMQTKTVSFSTAAEDGSDE